MGYSKNEWKPIKPEPMHCSSCGICLGAGYLEGPYPIYAGDKPLCGYCINLMLKDGYIQINSNYRLLPDGRVIKGRITLLEEVPV